MVLEGLSFSPRSIMEAEQKLRKPLGIIMSELGSVTNMLVLLEKGLKITPEQAEKKMTESLAEEGQGLNGVYMAITRALTDAGFLVKDPNPTEEEIQKVQEMVTSISEPDGEMQKNQQF